MSSGNFIVGKDLSIQGFNHYVLPFLEKYKSEVTDIMSFKDRYEKYLLISIIGDANKDTLERTINNSIKEARPLAEEDFQEKSRNKDNFSLIAWPHELSFEHTKTLGLYQDNETASKVYQNLAIEYSARSVRTTLESELKLIKSTMSSFAEKFKF